MKSTKIIAGLGVAAALGVAALPVATFAETTTTYKGQVGVQATIADEIAVKIDTNDMATGATPTSGTGVVFRTAGESPSTNLSAGAFYTAGATSITVSTNVPNTYTLAASGSVLSSATAEIPVAGIVAANSNLPADGTNGSAYNAGASQWGIKVAGVDKDSQAITLSDGTDATVFNNAGKYMIATDPTTVDYATVTAGKIENTYTVNYGLGITADQASGAYAGQANYTVTHVKN